jgi:hypothetical protein
MEAQYLAVPIASNAVVEVALASGTKTVLQVKPVTQDLVICGWAIESDGGSAGAPAIVELIDVDVAATVTTLTAQLWASPDLQAARAVGGTAATGYNASAEGTVTASRYIDGTELRPDGDKYVMWFPYGQQPRIAAGRFLRIRTVYTATSVNVIPKIWFGEG